MKLNLQKLQLTAKWLYKLKQVFGFAYECQRGLNYCGPNTFLKWLNTSSTKLKILKEIEKH